MNTTSTPEFATAELNYRRSRISIRHRAIADPAQRRWHRRTRTDHAA